MKNKSHITWWLGIKQKMSTKRSDEYVTIYIYDYDVTWNESVSDSFDITFSNNGTQINFADIINVWGCSCSMQTRTDLSFRFFSSVRKTFSSMRKDMAAFPGHSSKTWKHKWCEQSMFHLKDLLVILPFLFVLILFMNSWKTMV